MPVRRLGRQLRVPRELLEAWVGTTLHAPPARADEPVELPAPTSARRATKRTRNNNDAQLSLISND